MTAFPSRPPGIADPPPDPSRPLANERYERMAQLRASGRTQKDCYTMTMRPGESSKQPAPAASMIFRRVDVAARVDYLERVAGPEWRRASSHENATNPDAPQPGRRPANEPRDKAQDGTPLSRHELEQRLASAVREGDTPEVVAAAKLLQTMRPDLGGGDAQSSRNPDPVSVIQYVTTFAGMDGQAIVQQLGGWAFLRSKLCAVLRVSEGELLQGLTHGCATPQADASPGP